MSWPEFAQTAGGAADRDEHRAQSAGLRRDKLLVAANAALASLAGNADTHFAMVNEGAAPALVATLQHGEFTVLCTVQYTSQACLAWQSQISDMTRKALSGCFPQFLAWRQMTPQHQSELFSGRTPVIP